MAHLHEMRDMDTHFTINPATWDIQKANDGVNRIKRGDHNAEIFTFEIPKIMEGHDMSLCNLVQVHYINVDAINKNMTSEDVHEVKDLHVDETSSDTLVFSWKIHGNGTVYDGVLNFRILFACTNGSGGYDYKKWTGIYKNIPVGEGFDNTAQIEKQMSDILSKWADRIETVEDGGYYTPSVAQRTNKTMEIVFSRSKSSMPAVESQEITLPAYEPDMQNTLPQDGILKADTMYFLGTVTDLTFGLPQQAEKGDMLLVAFTTGVNGLNLNITTDNFIGLATNEFKASTYYELIAMWNGFSWVFVKNEVVA